MIKKVLTLGRDLEIIHQLLNQEGLEVVEANPDAIVTHGGDGILLEAERSFPGIPKLPLRYNSICKACVDHDSSEAIKAMARGTIELVDLPKLEGRVGDRQFVGLNEISVHHGLPSQAIRFEVRINGELYGEEAIGDGLIVATPFGSHAYYRSITNSTIRVGLGLAFNNTTEPIDHIVIDPHDTVSVRITRGPALILADNDPHHFEAEAGATLEIKLAKRPAQLLGYRQFRCPDCGAPAVMPSAQGGSV